MRFPVTWVYAAVLALLMAAGLAAPGQALAAPQAAIVMDMRDGTVFHADGADRRQHPASLTKMMTLYMTFEAVRDGRLGLDQQLRVSRNAARQPASKLYLKEGQRVAVRDLIRAAAIKSANDAAMVLAEGIGGSERAFAEMMTRRAHQLGMTNTTFRNPHGLTENGHLSTARDMATLARHLFFDFPEYYNIFSRKNDHAAGKQIWTTNRLLSSYSGADGIKTGYTRAAGYNLAASAHRGEERIIAVVMGAPSSAARNRKVAQLLDLGFNKAPRSARMVRPQSGARVIVASAPLPEAKPDTPATGFEALAEAIVGSAEAATPPAAAPISEPASRSRLAPKLAALPRPRGGAALTLAVAPAATAAMPAAAKPGIPMPPPRPETGEWTAQIGPYGTETAALASLADITARRIADAATYQVHRSAIGSGKPVYNLHLAGLTEGKAAQLCGVVSASSMACNIVHAAQ